MMERVTYVRVLIENDITKELPEKVTVPDPKGNYFTQRVQYDWKPIYCNSCLQVGHNCQKNRKQPDNANRAKPTIPYKPQKRWKATGMENTNIEIIEQAPTEQEGINKGKEIGQGSTGQEESVIPDEQWLSVRKKDASKGTTPKNAIISVQSPNGFNNLNEEGGALMTHQSPHRQAKGQSRRGREGNKVNLIAITEHRVQQRVAIQLIKKIARRWSWCAKYNSTGKGRIWVLWDPMAVDYEKLEKQDQYIHGKVHVMDLNIKFQFTAIYGLHTIENRKSLWRDLKNLHRRIQEPWLMMGDYNTIISLDDRINGSPVQANEIKDFRDFILDTRVNEPNYVGKNYT
ncbi:uncharacterized protein LOC132637460 [Lycium barbarum]|uniref:uncharacterized protein LOC132637460 n=1 Tax=Lycium barbarum TaxID=112863 RepID=UPI00293E7B67|nr:uncharacterized protein LOC132637460 [Lycium barbarum]